jgi:hypothetical protein
LNVQYLLSFRETAADFACRRDPTKAPAYWGAWHAYIGALNAAGVVVSGAGLEPPETATTVRVRGDQRQVHDGPYADTHEHLGGFFVIDVPSLDDALMWASRAPSSLVGSTEVRPVMPPPAR